MSTTIIFTPSHTGHNLEYLNNIYQLCLTMPLQTFVFVVPEQIREKLPLMKWGDAEHIKFDFITQKELDKHSDSSLLKGYYQVTKSVASRVRYYHADRAFSLFAYPLALFGWLMFPHYVRVSGILYNIYLYDLPLLSKRKKRLNWLVYNAFARSGRFEKVFILNDEKGAVRLRNIYRSDKFVKLPDPFTPISSSTDENIREKYGINQGDILLAHFGGLAKRKGTLNILQSIDALSNVELKHYVFFFAGKIDVSIRDKFATLYNKQKERVRIIVKDEFCSYGFLASLCRACDAILMPYLETSQSSGLLGYASYYHKPVIAPNNGLIRALVNQYKLGICGDVSRPDVLAGMYRQVTEKRIECPDERYVAENSIENFSKAIIKVIEDRQR